MTRVYVLFLIAMLGGDWFAPPALARTTAEAIEVIRQVGPEGRGNAAASAAWREVTSGGTDSLLAILRGMHGANPVALNWLRSAVDTIADAARAEGKLPLAELKDFVGETAQHPRARRLAFELIGQADPNGAQGLLAGMLDDPSTELRREAIARLIAEAAHDGVAREEAVAKYQRAVRSARDIDQIEAIAKALQELGHPVELAQIFGWVRRWYVIGPFDSTGGAGFEQAFAPEKRVDFAAEHPGKAGPIRWQHITTTNDYGLVDLNKPLGALKEVAGYAATEIHSQGAQSVEIRLGCKNAWKIWCNGQFLFGRDEYHRGIEIDQYRLKAQLKPGLNLLLVKVCQNAQVEDWTKEWEFQLRITDEVGTPILLDHEPAHD